MNPGTGGGLPCALETGTTVSNETQKQETENKTESDKQETDKQETENKSDQEGRMKERNNPRKNNPVEYSKHGKFHKSPKPLYQSQKLPRTLYFPHTKSLICPEHTNTIDLSNANPACGHKEVRRSTGHIMVTTRYSDQQGSKSRQKVMRLYKQWHRPISKRFIKPPYSISRATSIDSEFCRLPTTSVLSKKNVKITLQPVLINKKSKFLKATHGTEIRKNEKPRSMVVEALKW